MINSFRRQLEDYLLNLPLIVWILLGFLFTFISFFILPVFLNPALTMKFYQYIPVLTPVGFDFNHIEAYTYAWIHYNKLPVIIYPPFTFIFFAPFTLFSAEIGYKILIAATFICYLAITFIFPQWFNKNKSISAFVMLIAVTGLLSYGFQFELERGQWNLLAFSFCVASIYLFHRQPKYHWLAYFLFSISVQLKLFPAIFVFTLIEDFTDWKNNIKRIIGLGIFNILALFIFGLNPVLSAIEFLNKISPGTSSHFNHSLISFILFLFSKGVLPQKHVILWLTANKWLPQLVLFVLFGFCFLTILFQEFKRRSTGFRPCIFLACMIGACIIPSVSFDYKLSMLPACIAISIPEILLSEDGKHSPLVLVLVFIFSVAYSSMLYSYTNKPRILENNFPALLLILVIVTILSVIKTSRLAQSPSVDTKT